MRSILILVAALVAGAGATGTAGATAAEQPRREGEAKARAVRDGNILPLSVILERVRIPGARLIDVSRISATHYRLRYMRGENVLWIDVDARNGRIVGSAGF